jgi:hypothetical protein
MRNEFLREAFGLTCSKCGEDLGIKQIPDGAPIPMSTCDANGLPLCMRCAGRSPREARSAGIDEGRKHGVRQLRGSLAPDRE